MRVTVVNHPVVAAKLTALRDVSTDTPTFRRLVDDLVTLLAYEATRDVPVERVTDHDSDDDHGGGPAHVAASARRAGAASRRRACSTG